MPAAGGTTSTAAWGAHTWVRNDFTDTNFRVRLQADPGMWRDPQFRWTCSRSGSTGAWIRRRHHDRRHQRVPDQDLQGPGTVCAGVASCFHADGAVLNPRGFWATMNTEGAANVNGDAFQPYYDTPTSVTNPAYDADTYYNYAVEVPAGTTSGSVYVYDPVFCATAANKGTGDRWFSGAGDTVSSFYELYDTQNTLYDPSDDGAAIANSSGLFRNLGASDSSMGGGASGPECKTTTIATYGDGRDYHDQWYQLASGLNGGANGKVYRIHTTNTDPANVAAQRGTDGENSFALYSSIPGLADLRPGGDADVHPAHGLGLGGHLGVLPRPDRRGPRRQDGGDHALGSG